MNPFGYRELLLDLPVSCIRFLLDLKRRAPKGDLIDRDIRVTSVTLVWVFLLYLVDTLVPR